MSCRTTLQGDLCQDKKGKSTGKGDRNYRGGLVEIQRKYQQTLVLITIRSKLQDAESGKRSQGSAPYPERKGGWGDSDSKVDGGTNRSVRTKKLGGCLDSNSKKRKKN